MSSEDLSVASPASKPIVRRSGNNSDSSDSSDGGSAARSSPAMGKHPRSFLRSRSARTIAVERSQRDLSTAESRECLSPLSVQSPVSGSPPDEDEESPSFDDKKRSDKSPKKGGKTEGKSKSSMTVVPPSEGDRPREPIGKKKSRAQRITPLKHAKSFTCRDKKLMPVADLHMGSPSSSSSSSSSSPDAEKKRAGHSGSPILGQRPAVDESMPFATALSAPNSPQSHILSPKIDEKALQTALSDSDIEHNLTEETFIVDDDDEDDDEDDAYEGEPEDEEKEEKVVIKAVVSSDDSPRDPKDVREMETGKKSKKGKNVEGVRKIANSKDEIRKHSSLRDVVSGAKAEGTPQKITKANKHIYRSSEPDLLAGERKDRKPRKMSDTPPSDTRKDSESSKDEGEEREKTGEKIEIEANGDYGDKDKKSRKMKFRLFDLISPMFSLLKTSSDIKRKTRTSGKGKREEGDDISEPVTPSKASESFGVSVDKQSLSDIADIVNVGDISEGKESECSFKGSDSDKSDLEDDSETCTVSLGHTDSHVSTKEGTSSDCSSTQDVNTTPVSVTEMVVRAPEKISSLLILPVSSSVDNNGDNSSNAESSCSSSTMSSALTDFSEESDLDTKTVDVSDQPGCSTSDEDSRSSYLQDAITSTEQNELTDECEADSAESESDADLPDYGPLNPFLFIQQVNMIMNSASEEQIRSIFHFPDVYPVLPPKDPMDDRPTLVLDLDETLVHCSLEPIASPDIQFSVNWSGNLFVIYAYKRPHLRKFLEAVAPLFEVVLFTASQKVYADGVMDFLDPERRLVPYRLYRDSCVNIEGNFTKDLEVLGRDLARTVIVDNSPQAFAMQYDNGIPIIPYFDSKDDTELMQLLPFLEKLAVAPDVRPLLRQKYKMYKKIEVY